MNIKNLFSIAISLSYIFSICAMDIGEKITKIDFVGQEVILNTTNCCKIRTIAEESKTRIIKQWKEDEYYNFAVHPNKSLIAFSDQQNIQLCDTHGTILKQFILPNAQFNPNSETMRILIHCVFNPHNSTILCRQNGSFYSIDYEAEDNKTVDYGNLDSEDDADCYYGLGDFYIRANPGICFNPKTNEACLTKLNLFTAINDTGDRFSTIAVVNSAVEVPYNQPEKGYPLPLLCEYNFDGSYILYAQDSYLTARNPIVIFKVQDKNSITHDSWYPQTKESDIESGFVAAAVHPSKNVVATLLYPTMLLQYWNFITKKVLAEQNIFDGKDVPRQFGCYTLKFSLDGKNIIVLEKKNNRLLILDTGFCMKT